MVSDLLTMDEVAELLRVTTRTFAKYVKRGNAPPATLVGGFVRYRRSEVDRWLESRTVAPVAEMSARATAIAGMHA